MTTWIAIAGVGLGSYLLRFTPLARPRRESWPPAVERAIRRAALAALCALIVTGLHHHEAGGRPGVILFAGAAAMVSLVVTRRGGSMLTAVGAGLATYWSLTAMVEILR
jgi:branched-subunit amino acid transport protein